MIQHLYDNSNQSHDVDNLAKIFNANAGYLNVGLRLLASQGWLNSETDNITNKVFYNKPMPPDLKQSEQVVVIGKYNGDIFYANQILLKCPSKYEEESLKVSEVK